MNNILITGITGFVGGNLKNYLEKKHKITGISRKSNLNEEIISYGELNNYHCNKVKAFIHLAGKAHDLKDISKPEEYFEVNAELTKKLFDLFLQSDCEKFIFVSTVKAAADTIEGILTEDIEENPYTAYGQSKLEAEKYILSKEIPKEKRVYILRPCMIHGPNNRGNLNLLYKFISKKVPYPLGKFENKRSFVSIDNLCFIIKKIIESNIESGIYNIADDEPLSTNDLVKLIGNELDRPAWIINLPKLLVKNLAYFGDFLNLPFNTHRLNKLTENYIVSNEKIKKELKIKLPVSSIEGLTKTIRSFK